MRDLSAIEGKGSKFHKALYSSNGPSNYSYNAVKMIPNYYIEFLEKWNKDGIYSNNHTLFFVLQ